MLSSMAGFVLLLVVVFVSVLERGQTEIRYFDWHAAIVVLGGVSGSLLMALKGSTFKQMVLDWLRAILGRDLMREKIEVLKEDIAKMTSAWKENRRSEVLSLVESSRAEEVRVAADALIQHLQGQRLAERFESLRVKTSNDMLPQIEGWDMVARLSPSFGIVGTVAGMVQLFRNMATQSGGLGGAMAMALLATLYGILFGTAVGGPMSTRLNQQLNEHLSLIDLLERQVAALIEEDRSRKRGSEAQA